MPSAYEVPFLDKKVELFGIEVWGHNFGYEPGLLGWGLQKQGIADEELEPVTQAVKEAEDRWLERQAEQSGEFG